MRQRVPFLAGAALLAAAPVLWAQARPAAPPSPYPLLEVGATPPDFTLPGATRFGVLRNPVTLSSFRGRTVVLAFFIRARTKG